MLNYAHCIILIGCTVDTSFYTCLNHRALSPFATIFCFCNISRSKKQTSLFNLDDLYTLFIIIIRIFFFVFTSIGNVWREKAFPAPLRVGPQPNQSYPHGLYTFGVYWSAGFLKMFSFTSLRALQYCAHNFFEQL